MKKIILFLGLLAGACSSSATGDVHGPTRLDFEALVAPAQCENHYACSPQQYGNVWPSDVADGTYDACIATVYAETMPAGREHEELPCSEETIRKCADETRAADCGGASGRDSCVACLR